MRVFLIYLKGFGLGLGEAFAVDLGLAPEGCIGYGGKGWGKAPADGRVEGVRVKVRNGLAGFLPLWVEVFAPPDDVVKVALEATAVVTSRRDTVIKFRQLDFVVSTSTPGGVEIANVFPLRPLVAALVVL